MYWRRQCEVIHGYDVYRTGRLSILYVTKKSSPRDVGYPGTQQIFRDTRLMSAFGGKADIQTSTHYYAAYDWPSSRLWGRAV